MFFSRAVGKGGSFASWMCCMEEEEEEEEEKKQAEVHQRFLVTKCDKRI